MNVSPAVSIATHSVLDTQATEVSPAAPCNVVEVQRDARAPAVQIWPEESPSTHSPRVGQATEVSALPAATAVQTAAAA